MCCRCNELKKTYILERSKNFMNQREKWAICESCPEMKVLPLGVKQCMACKCILNVKIPASENFKVGCPLMKWGETMEEIINEKKRGLAELYELREGANGDEENIRMLDKAIAAAETELKEIDDS